MRIGDVFKTLIGQYGVLNWVPDLVYLKIVVSIKLRKMLHISHPRTFNEKIQWLKIHDRKPIYTKMVDKAEAKHYVEERIGSNYIIPTLGVWDRFEDIDFDKLPDQFVLKTTHDSGGVVVCRNKELFDKIAAQKKLRKSQKVNFYNYFREWPYKSVKRRIIAEEMLTALDEGSLVEYKILCFNEKPKYVLVCTGEGHTANRTNDYFDIDFNHLPVSGTCPNSKEKIIKPVEYDKLLSIAEKLAKGTILVRVDLYTDSKNIYFGELTMFPDAGCIKFVPDRYDLLFGNDLELPEMK